MDRNPSENPETEVRRGAIAFDDVDGMAESFRGTYELDYQQLEAPVAEGFCRYAGDGTTLVYEERYPATIGLRGSLAPGLFGMLLTDAVGAAGRWQGDAAPPDGLAHADSRVEVDVRMPGAARNIAVVMPLEVARERFEVLSGKSLEQLLPDQGLFAPLAPAARGRLEACWRDSLRSPLPPGDLAGHLVAPVVRALDREKGAGTTGSARASRITFRKAMARCEELGMKASPVDLALELGVCLRSLETAFRASMGMPPVRYLKLLRLNRAREQLARLEPDATQVGVVARDLGFTELGRFSGEYRRLFGELPSETLRKPPRKVRAMIAAIR